MDSLSQMPGGQHGAGTMPSRCWTLEPQQSFFESDLDIGAELCAIGIDSRLRRRDQDDYTERKDQTIELPQVV